MLKTIPELLILDEILKDLRDYARIDVPTTIRYDNLDFPLYTITMGNKDPKAPTLFISGGVHGLERIGSHVVLSFLEVLGSFLSWDEILRKELEQIRLVFMPIVNPVGMYLRRRSNGNRVDLMRNAPVEAEGRVALLVGGQRLSPYLPWYRGKVNDAMELEAQTLCNLAKKELFSAKIAISLDIHSGFGMIDRIWFPFAKSAKPFPYIAQILALTNMFDNAYPHHIYQIEPQAKSYCTAGDLWDFLFLEHQVKNPNTVYLPLTLEMGSWLWLKKNPEQLLSMLGPFNPIKPHRHSRILRRHLLLFHFLQRAIRSFSHWAELNDETRLIYHQEALNVWYT